VDQDFQQLIGFIPPPGSLDTYTASSSLRWVDWGARFGLNTQVDLTRGFSTGVGGWIGLANRQISWSASDSDHYNGLPQVSSSLTATANTTPFLANAEGNLTYRPLSGVALRGFVGLNYDNKVPGFLPPSVVSSVSAGPAVLGTAALTSWYAGGGGTIKFAP